MEGQGAAGVAPAGLTVTTQCAVTHAGKEQGGEEERGWVGVGLVRPARSCSCR